MKPGKDDVSIAPVQFRRHGRCRAGDPWAAGLFAALSLFLMILVWGAQSCRNHRQTVPLVTRLVTADGGRNVLIPSADPPDTREAVARHPAEQHASFRSLLTDSPSTTFVNTLCTNSSDALSASYSCPPAAVSSAGGHVAKLRPKIVK